MDAPVGEDDVLVDLVAQDQGVVPPAQLRQGGKLLPRPHPAHGVVGAAQQHRPGSPGQEAFQPLQVHDVTVLPAYQGVPEKLPAVCLHHRREGRVHRGLHHHPVSGTGQDLQGHRHPGHHPRSVADPVRVHVPTVAGPLPGRNGLPHRTAPNGVAEDPVVHPPVQRLQHRRRCGKLHVCDPEGQQVLLPEQGSQQVPLLAPRSLSENGTIEIEVHETPPFGLAEA